MKLPNKRNWNRDEINILKKYRPHLAIEELRRFLPCRNPRGIWAKSEKLKIGNIQYNNRFWTSGEIAILGKYYPSHNHNVKELKRLLPNRTWMAIKLKAEKLGLECWHFYQSERSERFKEQNKKIKFNQKRLKALCQKPTKPEKQLIEIIEENKLPYKYVGDGSFIIQGFNPDFVNVNGQKKIIEVFGRIWHETLVKHWNRTELGRVMIYNSYGYKTLVIWDDELKNKEAVAKRVIKFSKTRSN